MEARTADYATDADVQETANRIKRQYFPKWDPDNEWKFELVEDVDGAMGRALHKEKVIRILEVSRDTLPLLLIHEMCHAVYAKRGGGHGNLWKNRMLKAATDAELKFSDTDLSMTLRQEVQRYLVLMPNNKGDYYQELRDAVLDIIDRYPTLEELLGQYDSVEEWVRRDHGMSLEDFRAFLPRAPKVFEKYARDAWKRRLQQKKSLVGMIAALVETKRN